MIKLTKELASKLQLDLEDIGYTNEFGAVVGNHEFIIYYADGSDIPYLAHISEFEQIGILIRLKETPVDDMSDYEY